MKKRLFQKLKSESGASLVAALFFFVIVAVIGSAIIAAASSSMGRTAAHKDDEDGSGLRYELYSYADLIAVKAGEAAVLEVTEDSQQTENCSYESGSGTEGPYYRIETREWSYTVDGEWNVIEGENEELLPELHPNLVAGSAEADDLAGIIRAMAVQTIESYWDSYVVSGWSGEAVPQDHGWKPPAQADSEGAFRKEYLHMYPDGGEDGDYGVWVRIEMEEDLDILAAVFPYLSEDPESDLQEAVQALYVQIPLKPEAKLVYEQPMDKEKYKYLTYTDGSTGRLTIEEYDVLPDSARSSIRKQSTCTAYDISRTLTFTDFAWDEALITTVKPA